MISWDGPRFQPASWQHLPQTSLSLDRRLRDDRRQLTRFYLPDMKQTFSKIVVTLELWGSSLTSYEYTYYFNQ